VKPAVFLTVMLLLFVCGSALFAYVCFPSVKAQVDQAMGVHNGVYELSAGESPEKEYFNKLSRHKNLVISLAEKYAAITGDDRIKRYINKMRDPMLTQKINDFIAKVNSDPALKAKIDKKIRERFGHAPGNEAIASETFRIFLASSGTSDSQDIQKIRTLLETVEVQSVIAKHTSQSGKLKDSPELRNKIKTVLDKLDLENASSTVNTTMSEKLPTADSWNDTAEENKETAGPHLKTKPVKYQEESLPVFSETEF